MNVADAFQVILLWAHAMAAVAWVGGSLFYAVVLLPAVQEVGPTPERRTLLGVVGREFGEVIRLAILVFVLTGAILAYSRLSQPRVTPLYVGILAVKVALSLWMFWLAGRLGQRPRPEAVPTKTPTWLAPPYLILELGALVYLLSLALRVVFEQSFGIGL